MIAAAASARTRLLGPDAALELLREAGVPLVASRTGADGKAAAAAAAGLGFPVVLKAGGLNHKTEAAGVVLGLADTGAVRAAADDLIERLGDDALPLVVQPQAHGVELLAGIKRAPGVGASVVVGMGGVNAELLGDIASAMAPFDAAEANALLRRLRCWPLLDGYRGAVPCDVTALSELLVRVSQLAQARPDIAELDLNPVFVGPRGAGAFAADVRVAVMPPFAGADAAPKPLLRAELTRMFSPGAIAVVGVSDTSGSVGAAVFDNLLAGGFAGRVIPVHRAGGHRRGHECAPAVAAIEPAPDLVCAAVRAGAVPKVAAEAAARGCGALIVFSAGFAEADDEGAALQKEIVTAAGGGLAVLGPNSLGVLSPGQGVLASFAGMLRDGGPPAGHVALVTASGALGSCLASRLADAGVGLSRWVSLGNEADVTLADCIRWLAEDDQTAIVGAIVDHVADGPRLVGAVERARARGKPVLACLLARTDSGSAAAQSHTGALVGAHGLRRDVLSAAGAVEVEDLQQLEDALALAARQPLPAGRRVGVVTASGGACTIVADEVHESSSLQLPEIPERLRAELVRVLPPFAMCSNPLDITATITSDPAGFAAALRAFAKSGAFDAVLVQLTTNADPVAAATAREVVAAVDAPGPPVYVARYGSPSLAPEAMALYRRHRVPLLDTPQRLVRAVDALVRCSASLRGPDGRA